MEWVLWVIVGLMAVGVVLGITQIGKERVPLTPGVAAISTVLNVLIIWAIIAIGIF